MHPIFKVQQFTPKLTKFSIGAPLPEGKFFVTQNLRLLDHNEDAVKVCLTAIQLWPDNSIKWINFSGCFTKDMNPQSEFYLSVDSENKLRNRLDWVKEQENNLVVNTQLGTVNLDLDDIFKLKLNNGEISSKIVCKLQNIEIEILNIATQYKIVADDQQHPLSCNILQSAQLFNKNKHIANLIVRLKIHYIDGQIDTEFDLHNLLPIEHDNGQWDLGNTNSFIITSFKAEFNYNCARVHARFSKEHELKEFDSITLLQCSSGGENWNSVNHKNSNNLLELKCRGAIGELVSSGTKESISFNRPSPQIRLQLKDNFFYLIPQHFWEKFPSSLNCNKSKSSLDFADPKTACTVELQPGEIKSHKFTFGLSAQIDNLTAWSATPLLAISSQTISNSHSLPFSYMKFEQYPLNKILNFEEHESSNWFNKREQVDEYGWRNFGDIYADHEAANHKGNETFVSHYNNQYDPLYGFLKLWMLTGDCQYKTLADELFDHLANIDIYHTQEDKPEYNQGLFWHTDHYVPAETATHRTYSKRQETGVYMDHAGGGGPGAHHCYSSGLALNYLLTGNTIAQQSVIGLANWMSRIYEGDGTLLGLILRAKNANHIKIPLSNKLLLGTGTGIVRNIFTNRYPLDRGTGNYINTLLDTYEVTQQQLYLNNAEYVLLNTIDASDNIAKRNFDDIENTWFYTVLLQAAIKYLSIKFQLKSETSNSAAVRNAFIHYANYIVQNETYYLANAHILEYPNDTWTGQDLRKIQILLCGSVITNSEEMLNKAKQLIEYVYPKLQSSEESKYTRIQALIMQNMTDLESIRANFSGYQEWLASCELQVSKTLNIGYTRRIIRFIRQYSIKNEYRLLCIRIPQIRKVFKK